jgi:hypothetical protein
MRRGRTQTLYDDRGLICLVQPEQGSPGRVHRAAIVDLIGLYAILGVVLAPAMYVALRDGRPVVAIPATAVAAAAALFMAGRWITARRRVAIERLLLIDRCPACDYDLAGIAPEHDGCTLCPECEAAWRLGETA